MIRRGIIIVVLVVLSLSCARVVMPPGGPEDKTPPKVLESSPENFSTQFYSDKVVINFDEYIVLKDFNSEFVSSPVFNEKPDKILRGKSLVLKFDKDSLVPNTTYTLDFGNSIIDYRRGNILEHFQYVFSTGESIDSLHISGHLVLAEDLKPQEKVWILLYKNFNDSVLRTQRPDFIAKTDVDGYFSINNIAAGTYTMAALKDINSNYLFDLPNEQIAFLDSSFVLSIAKAQLDSNKLSLDTFQLSIDSLQNSEQEDTLNNRPSFNVSPTAIDLFLFEEDFSNLYLSEYKREHKHLLSLAFSEPYDSTLNISIENTQEKQWLVEPNSLKDTFKIWLIDTALAHRDSIEMIIEYYRTDSTQSLVLGKDTLAFNTKKRLRPRVRKPKLKEQDSIVVPKKYLKLKANFIEQNPFDFYKTLSITSSFPLDSVDISKIEFYEKVDTTYILTEVLIEKDSLKPRQYNIKQTLKEDTDYKVFVAPDAFVDYRHYGNDTLLQMFKTTKLAKYTEIQLKVSGIGEHQVIIQLINASDNILEERVLQSDSALVFSFLKPGNYKFKMIVDTNGNEKWDTGNYDLRIQPEKILFYPEAIPTKANWSHEIVWDLKKD